MYPGQHAIKRAEQPAVIIAETGAVLTFAELEARSNRLAHLLRVIGLRRLDHYAIFMENNSRYIECCAAGERSGLYFTCVNSLLAPDELAYILHNSESRVLITSKAKRDVAVAASRCCPLIEFCLVADGEGEGSYIRNLDDAAAAYPNTPIAGESLGGSMLYSSGTTGRPKGVLFPLPQQPPCWQRPNYDPFIRHWKYRGGMINLSPGPLYHAAPQGAVTVTIRGGGTALIMERFDPERFLEFVQNYKVSQCLLVPTMFSRMLKLPEEVRRRYDLSSLEVAVHGAAPCPVQVKEQMIKWWGPILHEYYGATEGLGATLCDSAEWMAHKGTVGRVVLGELHVLDEEMRPCATGTPGTLWFKHPQSFEYFNDAVKTAKARSGDGLLTTVDDVGYLDEEGYVYLTDRSAFMIISGGVNIYPQECENLLITHPTVADAAVFGVPNEDLGEEVKAVVQLMPDISPGPEIIEELIAFCCAHLARYKCPRSIEFEVELPRSPTGKLYKRLLRDRYWGGRHSQIV
jgi:long-chain acyl-CoA synthetase